MNIEEQVFTRISQYLDQQLSQEEQADIERKMASDQLFRQQVRYVQELKRGVKDIFLRQEMADLWDQQMPQVPVSRSGKPQVWTIAGIAASILLLIGGIWLLNRSTQDSPGQQLAQSKITPDLEFQSNLSSSNPDLISQVESNLINEDYQTAKEGALSLLKEDSAHLYARYLLGIAEIGNESYGQAIPHLQQVIKEANDNLDIRAQWWLVLGYLGLDQVDDARLVLRQIEQSSREHYRKQGAQELLGILSSYEKK